MHGSADVLGPRRAGAVPVRQGARVPAAAGEAAHRGGGAGGPRAHLRAPAYAGYCCACSGVCGSLYYVNRERFSFVCVCMCVFF